MDNYLKLRPRTDIEFCDCPELNSLLLVYTLSDNPIHCYTCKGVVDPETLALDSKLVDDIASWHGIFSSLYNLWLSSGEYEIYAKACLQDKNGEVNLEGMEAAAGLCTVMPAWYWWFHDVDDPQPTQCPSCGGSLDGDTRHGCAGKCLSCKVVI